MNQARIQLQDGSGNWQTYQTTLNEPSYIRLAMEQLSGRFPGQRVRATDESGRLLDML